MRISLVILLAFILLLRATFLETPNLVEPTEGRYAAMANRMVETNNWLFPEFPIGDDYQPYLGKPPLFFWLTALSYKSFGVDEWSGRLPSFLCYVFVALSLIVAGVLLKRVRLFGVASLIWTTSLIPFFFSGAIVLDICLTAAITAALLAALVAFETERKRLFVLLFWIGAAVGVLIKGPVAAILLGMPLFVYTVATKNYIRLKVLFRIEAIALFCFIVIPWFYLTERQNPGFLNYFFIHENFLRYFSKNYGDLYGSGHRYPYGTAVLFFLVAFFPWSILLIGKLKKALREGIDPILHLPAIACVLTVLFFCAMRQLHIGYLIPALPWAALLVGYWYERSSRVVIASGITAVIFAVSLFAASPFVNVTYSSTRMTACIARFRPQSLEAVAVFGTKSYGARLLQNNWQEELMHPLPLTFISSLGDATDSPTDLMILKSIKNSVDVSKYHTVAELGPWEWLTTTENLCNIKCSVSDEA